MAKLNLDINGDNVAVRIGAGSGQAVVLVHGNSASGKAFGKQYEDGGIDDIYKTIAVDLPGHGASDKASNPDTYSLPGYAEVIVKVAKEMGAEDAVFVGWSLGGHILLEAVDMLPNAKGFLIYGTPPVGKPPAMDEAFLPHPTNGVLYNAELSDDEAKQFAQSFFRSGARSSRQFRKDILNTDGQARAQLGVSVGAGNYKDELEVVKNLSVPLAVLHGAEEQLVNGDYIKGLEIPTLWRGEVQMIDGAGHAPQWETPDTFNALVKAFVEDVT